MDPPLERLNVAITRLARAHRAAAADRLAEFGLHPAQEAVLFELHRHGRLRPAALARSFGVGLPTISKSLARMERQGLIERSKGDGDRRDAGVELTARGRDVVPAVRETWQALAEATLTGLDLDERAAFVALLERAAGNLHAASARSDGGAGARVRREDGAGEGDRR